MRYYLDFCGKYNLPSAHKDSLPKFIRKLHEKKQSKEQQDQATIAVKLYYEVIKAKDSTDKKIVTQSVNPQKDFTSKNVKAFSVRESAAISSQNKNTSNPVNPSSIKNISADSNLVAQATDASWKAEYSGLENEIRVRHYSPKTLRTYKGWVQKFQTFTKSKNPELLSPEDVKEYLTFLAIKRKVSSITQNQASCGFIS